MINWDKPIETVDGRKAKLLSCVMPVGGDYSSGWAVYVSPPPGAVFGDVFLVDEEGFRCDDSAPIPRPQIIRNARVKRKAWIRLPIHDFYKGDTKEEIEAQITNANYKAVFAEWEE